MEKNISTFVDDDLNEDCLLEIFSYLSIHDMMQVKNVCRKWREAGQQWFKQVQTLVFRSKSPKTWKWKLHAKYYERKLTSGTDIKELIPILKLFGHHIKYFHIDDSNEPIPDPGKLIFPLIPTLCENVEDAYIYTYSYLKWDLDMMVKHWKQLDKFIFRCFSSLAEENMGELLRNNQQLKFFSLQYYVQERLVSDKFLTYLPTKIEAIDITMRTRNKNELTYFVSTIKNFTSLSSLQLSTLFFLSDAAGAAIGNLKSLKHLALSSISHYESQSTINPIANLENLESLELCNNRDLKEDNLINIVNNCKNLEQIMIYSRTLTDKGMGEISKLEKLKILAIGPGSVSTESIINLCDKLEVFLCNDSKMNNDDAIKLLEKATNLFFVEFTHCKNLTKDVVNAANEIANGKKKNILHMVLYNYSMNFDNVETPYFKCNKHLELLSLELLPNYIRDYLRGYRGYG